MSCTTLLATLVDYFCDRGIPVMGEYPSGASIASGDDYENGWTTYSDVLISLAKGYGDVSGRGKGCKIRRFRFIPKQAGYLVIDIDRHEGKIDGLQSFYKFLSQNHINEPMLKDIENGSFPCFVTTPNNGFHLYFKYSGNENFPRKLTDGVEVFYSDRAFITAPFSVVPGIGSELYMLYDDLNDAPYLFPSLHNILVSKMPKYYVSHSLAKRKYSLKKIAEFVEMDKKWCGRNDKSFLIACRTRKEGYSKEEAWEFLRTYAGLDGLPESEIISTIKSAYQVYFNE